MTRTCRSKGSHVPPLADAAIRLLRRNLAIARNRWGTVPEVDLLKQLTVDHLLSVGSGDVLLLDGRWYVTHRGLLRLARRSRCAGISVESVAELSDARTGRWAFKATVIAMCGRGQAVRAALAGMLKRRGALLRLLHVLTVAARAVPGGQIPDQLPALFWRETGVKSLVSDSTARLRPRAGNYFRRYTS